MGLGGGEGEVGVGEEDTARSGERRGAGRGKGGEAELAGE